MSVQQQNHQSDVMYTSSNPGEAAFFYSKKIETEVLYRTTFLESQNFFRSSETFKRTFKFEFVIV